MSAPVRVAPGAATVDVVLAFVLTAAALAGWGTTYDGSRWLVVGLTGAAVAGALAAMLAVRGWGLDMLLLLLIPVYLLSAGPVASSVRIGDRMFEDVIGGTVNSWALLVGTHPPVDSRGVLLLPPYLVGLATGGLATGLALRSRSPGAPVGPPLVALGAVLVLGRHEPAALLAQSVAFAALAVVWVLLRGLRQEAAFRGAAVVPRLVAAAVVLAVAAGAAPAVADRLDVTAERRLVLREVVPAYDVRKVDTPLAEFRRFTDQPVGALGNVHDSPLVTVDGLPPGTRLRFVALDTYDQDQFRPGDGTVPGRYDDRFLRVGRRLDNPATGREAFVNVTVHRSWDSQWVPTAGALQWFGFEGRRSTSRATGFRYNPATASGLMTTDLTSRDSYEFSTIVGDDRLTPRMEPYPDLERDLWEQARFVHIPAQAWSAGATSPMDAVFRAAETLRTTGRYSDGAEGYETKYLPGHDRPRIGPGFIHGSLTGNDEQYATVMALVAVRLGVPARVVVGAVLPRSGVVRGADVSAWVEVRVADGSWRTLPTEDFMGSVPPGEDRFDQNPDPNIKLPGGLPEQEPRPPEQEPADPRTPGATAQAHEPLWWPWVVLGVALSGGLLPLVKWVRRRRRLGHARITRRYAGAWLELVDQARDLGTPVPAGLTRQAQAVLIGRGQDLAWEADRAVFGIDEPTAADAAAYWAAIDAERRALRAAAPWSRRLLAPARWQLRAPEVAASRARGGSSAGLRARSGRPVG